MKNFSLIETVLWEKGGLFLKDLHMERLERSAAYFSFPFKKDAVLSSIERHVSVFDPLMKYRVRLLVSSEGEIDISSKRINPGDTPAAKTCLSDKKTSSSDIFLAHKTTNRALYDEELTRCREKGYYDVIFMNTEGEITEGAVTNIVLKKKGMYFTPPLSRGVLPGTYREYLLRSKTIPIKEKVLLPEDLDTADGIFLINSVRKMVDVKLTP
jgi:para-aminobenzoate synthetase / 4-amino-4-deoxychorismate lyase